MSSVLDSRHKENKSMESRDPNQRKQLFELEDENGFLFNQQHLVPEEILTMILSHISPLDLLKCRNVCKSWCNLIDVDVWRNKIKRIGVNNVKKKLPWVSAYLILSRIDLFETNLLKNECGQNVLEHWKVLSNGGDRWLIETPPVGCEDFPLSKNYDKYKSCFTSSYYSCSKEQVIDLTSHGRLMDVVQPHIQVSEWFCGRFDCRAVYEILVELLDEDNTPLDAFEVRKNVGGNDGWSWQQIEHTFHDYPPGVRSIKFYHGGVDQQFWRGHYGSKMTDACIMLKLPTENHSSVPSS